MNTPNYQKYFFSKISNELRQVANCNVIFNPVDQNLSDCAYSEASKAVSLINDSPLVSPVLWKSNAVLWVLWILFTLKLSDNFDKLEENLSKKWPNNIVR